MQQFTQESSTANNNTQQAGKTSYLLVAGVSLLAVLAAVSLYSLHALGFEPPTAMLLFVLGSVVASAGAYLVVATKNIHGRFTMDNALGGIQRSHTVPVPRIGGVAVVLGFAAISIADGFASFDLPAAVHSEFTQLLAGLLLCAIPAALSGFIEDVTKKVSVKVRLFATIASGLIASAWLGATIPHFNVWGLDSLMTIPLFAALATAFCAGGVANAVNIIDGFNGLASGALVVMAAGFALLGVSLNDPIVVLLALSVASVAAGFMVVNYPSGRVFLGDGGAYLLGFMLAELAIVTAARHPELNAFTVLTLIAYPVLEVAVSVVRRRMAKMSPGDPDRGHMHQQVQEAIRHTLGRVADRETLNRVRRHVPSINPQVSPVVWVIVALMVATGLSLSTAGAVATLGFVVCAALYLGIYRTVVAYNRQSSVQRGVLLTPALDIRPTPAQGVVMPVVGNSVRVTGREEVSVAGVNEQGSTAPSKRAGSNPESTKGDKLSA